MHKKNYIFFFLRAPPLVSSFFVLLLLWTSFSLSISLSLESHIALPITPFVKAQVCIDIDLYGVVFNSPYSIGFSPSFLIGVYLGILNSIFIFRPQILNSLNWRVFHAIGFSEIVLLLLTWVLIFFIIFSIVIELQLIDFWPKETRVYRWL